ncbi:hypothetical protein B0H66DRAFT_106526 [Apodospora peruviana]|uniref:Secreted protein n=1 Tax=Apodospora peruviana TaxID=516989 RepID=A0AAE0IHM7_9PEZI|nr:hypothetical protein B0H66DRAFT_106526 [Apodospora peruviana]
MESRKDGLAMPLRLPLPLLLLLLTLSPVVSAITDAVSIASVPAWRSLRSCAQGCIFCRGDSPELLADGLGCGGPWPNSCFCRTDLNSIATQFLSSCIHLRCTVGDARLDFTSAHGPLWFLFRRCRISSPSSCVCYADWRRWERRGRADRQLQQLHVSPSSRRPSSRGPLDLGPQHRRVSGNHPSSPSPLRDSWPSL